MNETEETNLVKIVRTWLEFLLSKKLPFSCNYWKVSLHIIWFRKKIEPF